MRKFLNLLCFLGLAACAKENTQIVPAIMPHSAQEPKVVKVMPNNIIGAVERIYLPPMKSAFMSRIDTGAAYSALDAEYVKKFERDGQSWVEFKIVNRTTQEEHVFEKPIAKHMRIKRIGEDEHRPRVEMDVKMGGQIFKADFTIAEREKFEYQMLIGRNILSGRAIVDVSVSNTLK
jgi:hypothetical protein